LLPAYMSSGVVVFQPKNNEIMKNNENTPSVKKKGNASKHK